METKTRQLLDLIREYDKMRKTYLSSYKSLSTLRDDLRAGKYRAEDMINFIYVMREISKLADDLRKEADGIGHMFENSACAVYVSLNRTDPIRASLATGSPDLKLGVKIPNQKLEPKKFAELMSFFGIPSQAISDRIVAPYWPGLCEYVSMLAEEGKKLPPGIDPEDTYPTYKVRIVAYKNLDELIRDLERAKRKEADEACDELSTLLTTRQ